MLLARKTHTAADSRWRDKWVFAAVGVVILLAVAASFLFATQLNGPGEPEARRLDTGWFYQHDGGSEPIASFPSTLDVQGGELLLRRDLSEEEKLHSRYVLTLRSRYASVRVWADDTLVYEAAQGEEHALGSMWHFIPMSQCTDADQLTVELRVYGGSEYTVESFLLDTPGAIRYTLIMDNISAILFGVICLLLTVITLLAAMMLKWWKSRMYAPVLEFSLFLLLSGAWIFLDSKITTLGGGNYAVSYFLSYAAFYLMPVPFLLYIRFMAKDCRRLLNVLVWAFLFNAGISLILHMTGLVQLRHTAAAVHALIVVSLPVSTAALWRGVIRGREKQLRFTFGGILAVYAFGLISIVLFYLKRLPAANSTQLYMVGLFLLIIGIFVDMVTSFSRFWRMKEDAEHYRRLAVEDSMTEIGNRNAFEMHLTTLLNHPLKKLAFVVFDVDNLKQINDQMGHHVGDQAIYMAARCIQAVFSQAGDCYRIGGDEFAVILTEKDVSKVPMLLERFRQEVALNWAVRFPSGDISYGWSSAEFSDEEPAALERIAQLREEADRSLYRQKQVHKAKNTVASTLN